jgi:hypothetical protein
VPYGYIFAVYLTRTQPTYSDELGVLLRCGALQDDPQGIFIEANGFPAQQSLDFERMSYSLTVREYFVPNRPQAPVEFAQAATKKIAKSLDQAHHQLQAAGDLGQRWVVSVRARVSPLGERAEFAHAAPPG